MPSPVRVDWYRRDTVHRQDEYIMLTAAHNIAHLVMTALARVRFIAS